MRIFLLFIIFCLPAYSAKKIKIITTTTNLADLAKQIGGNQIEVESLCKGVQDPHYLEAKPSYTFKLSKADLLISIGAGLEQGWLPLVVRGSRNPKIREGQSARLVASDAVELLEKHDTHISRSQGDVHPEGNPHFMLSPQKSIEVAKKIKSKISEIAPSQKSYFEKRLQTYSSRLMKGISRWEKMIKKGQRVISYHKTLTYFYHDFHVQNVNVLEPKPGIPPAASHILKVISQVKEQGVKKIIVENYFDDAVARKIKRSVPDVSIEVVPTAVQGQKGINDLFSLYDYLAQKIGEEKSKS